MEIMPADIQEKQFRVRFRGFDIHEVDAFLEEVSSVLQSLIGEKNHLEKEVEALRRESLRQKEREKTFARVLADSQKVLDQMKENARKSAEMIIADAEVKAERMLNRAHNRLSQLHDDIAELRRQRMQIEVQIQAVLEGHVRLLEMGRQEMKVLDEEDAKLKLLKQHPSTKGAVIVP